MPHTAGVKWLYRRVYDTSYHITSYQSYQTLFYHLLFIYYIFINLIFIRDTAYFNVIQ